MANGSDSRPAPIPVADLVREQSPLGSLGRTALGFYSLVLPTGLIVWLVRVWPSVTAPRPAPGSATDPLVIGLSSDQAALVMMALLGALGGAVHALGSFTVYAGNRALIRSWVWWYLARAPVGAALAVVVYFVIRGGLIASDGGGVAALSPYGLGAFAALAGLSSEIATQKLREVFEVLFRPREIKKDAVSAQEALRELARPAETKAETKKEGPRLASVSPAEAKAGSGALTVELSGEGFEEADVVLADEREVDSSVRSEGVIEATIPAKRLRNPGTVRIVVRRAGPGGASSEPLGFRVT